MIPFSFFFFLFLILFFLIATCHDAVQLEFPINPDLFAFKNCAIAHCVYQKEQGGATGAIHYQCAFCFKNQPCLSALRSKFQQFFWQYMVATFAKASAYCTKLETRVAGPWQIVDGVHSDIAPPPSLNAPPTSADAVATGPGQGKSSRLKELTTKIINKETSLRDISIDYACEYVRNGNGIHRLMMIHQDRRNFKTFVSVFHGMTGCGKTWYVMDYAEHTYGMEETFIYDSIGHAGQEWWDGYHGQKLVIIEEMAPGKFAYDRLLRLFDRYPVTVPYKGGSCTFAPIEILVTSNYAPRAWYPDLPVDKMAAILRRIDLCFKVCMQTQEGKVLHRDDGTPDYLWVKDTDNMCPAQDDPAYEEWLFKLHKDNDYVVDVPVHHPHLPVVRPDPPLDCIRLPPYPAPVPVDDEDGDMALYNALADSLEAENYVVEECGSLSQEFDFESLEI